MGHQTVTEKVACQGCGVVQEVEVLTQPMRHPSQTWTHRERKEKTCPVCGEEVGGNDD